MSTRDPDDWLQPPRAPAAGGVIGQPADEAEPEPEPAPAPQSFDLLAPEHRDKLAAMFRWAAEGRQWDEVKGEALEMFGMAGRSGEQPSREPTARDP